MTHVWGRATEAGLFAPGYEFDGDEGQELGEDQYAVAAGLDDKAVIYGSRAALLALGQRMVVGFAGEPGHPAATFNVDAFRAWLDGDTGQGKIRDVEPLATAYQRLDGAGGWLVEGVLSMLHDADWHGQSGWRLDGGVTQLKVWATADPAGGPDGGIAGEVVVDQIPVSLGRITERELIPGEHEVIPGYEAAELALTVLAERIDDVAARTRAVRTSGVVGLTTADIETALATLVEYRDAAPHRPELSERQIEVAERVALWLAGSMVIEGKVVDDGVPYSAHGAAAAAVDNDYNHPAHPDHW